MIIIELKKTSRFFLVKIQRKNTITHFKSLSKSFYFLLFKLFSLLYETGILYKRSIVKTKINNIFKLSLISKFH